MMVSATRASVSACDASVGVRSWVDPVVQAGEYQRFDSYVVTGPRPSECDFFVGLSVKAGMAGTRRKCVCYDNIVWVIV
jgi:hypothetical protein